MTGKQFISPQRGRSVSKKREKKKCLDRDRNHWSRDDKVKGTQVAFGRGRTPWSNAL